MRRGSSSSVHVCWEPKLGSLPVSTSVSARLYPISWFPHRFWVSPDEPQGYRELALHIARGAGFLRKSDDSSTLLARYLGIRMGWRLAIHVRYRPGRWAFENDYIARYSDTAQNDRIMGMKVGNNIQPPR